MKYTEISEEVGVPRNIEKAGEKLYYDILNRTTGEVTKNVQEETVYYA